MASIVSRTRKLNPIYVANHPSACAELTKLGVTKFLFDEREEIFSAYAYEFAPVLAVLSKHGKVIDSALGIVAIESNKAGWAK